MAAQQNYRSTHLAKNKTAQQSLNLEDHCNFACNFSIKFFFFVLSMSDIKQLTNGILRNGNSITSMW